MGSDACQSCCLQRCFKPFLLYRWDSECPTRQPKPKICDRSRETLNTDGSWLRVASTVICTIQVSRDDGRVRELAEGGDALRGGRCALRASLLLLPSTGALAASVSPPQGVLLAFLCFCGCAVRGPSQLTSICSSSWSGTTPLTCRVCGEHKLCAFVTFSMSSASTWLMQTNPYNRRHEFQTHQHCCTQLQSTERFGPVSTSGDATLRPPRVSFW